MSLDQIKNLQTELDFPFSIKKVDHIGIAVKNLENSLAFYKNFLGAKNIHFHEVPSEKVKVAMFHFGETKLELLQPSNDESAIAKFIAKRGEGIHHICLEVDDLEKALEKLQEEEGLSLDKSPRIGAGNCKVAFLHPKKTGGVLIELSQPPLKP